jgi:inosine-uridine nucleoside N-ribohydrolase
MQFGRGGKPSAGTFFDSDFATVDTLLALGVLHGMQGKNDCRVAILTMSRPNVPVAGYIDAVERFYRGPAGNFAQVPPIGMRTTGSAGDTPAAFTAPFSKKKADGTPAYLNKVATAVDTGDPNTLFRNYLQSQYDQNAFFILAGPATNLAAALGFRGMKDLIAAKIKYLVVAGGAFPSGPAETHIKADIAAAKKVFAEWPTPIIVAGNEIGTALEFPGASIDKEFAAAVPDNPVADAYRAWKPMPYNTPSLAMAASLYAGRPKEGYFKLSEPGTITIHDDGQTSHAASADGKHQYLIADPAQQAKIIQAYIDLASAKPVPPQRFRPPAAADVQKAAEVENKVPPL